MALRSLARDAYSLVALGFVIWHSLQHVDALAVERRYVNSTASGREVIKLDKGWKFWRSEFIPDNIIYDLRPNVSGTETVLKPWILPMANEFINDPSKHYERPASEPDIDVPYVQKTFDDSEWETVKIPHDWAIKGPFYTEEDPPVGGGMGRLPVQGVGWYRRMLTHAPADEGRTIYLDMDGAMSYPMVWLNGHLVGGWPYGYNSFRLDLTSFLKPGNENILAIRTDNPIESSRWYPGGGIYRNVWLTKVNPTHVAQSGTYITSREVSSESATLDLVVQVKTTANATRDVEIVTSVYEVDPDTERQGCKVAEFPEVAISVDASARQSVSSSVIIENPRLWGPAPQEPNMYVAITRLYVNKKEVDAYKTPFGIRSVVYDPDHGLLVNGEAVHIRGVNQHHDLGALGAAFNERAAERQLEILEELGCNAIRTSHNPPTRELLDLADRKGFLVMDEIFDSWYLGKNPSDFHLIFGAWHEPDLRAFLRRDRNHPSVVIWSFGNEVGEQAVDVNGTARALRDLMHEEDPTRPATASMNAAKPNGTFALAPDVLSLNYQGEGIRDTPAYSQLNGTTTPPLYDAFHAAFPAKMLLSTETAAALSTRGTYLFPVLEGVSAPVNDSSGGDSGLRQVSAYELYSADFGASADKTFAAQDVRPFVAGEFVWSGWDYLGEPTPYYEARSSYFGIVDLAGFRKDRFYLYQARWRPELRMAHILPHWTWPGREGLVTPVHVFSAADEAELFLNGASLGRRQRAADAYRLRFDDVVYAPGLLEVVTYKDGAEWARDAVRTAGQAATLRATPDRAAIKGDGDDLSFITVEVLDDDGVFVAPADDTITFSVSGPGEIVATDNGNPADMTAFPSRERKAFGGLALVIVRALEGAKGPITVTAAGAGLREACVVVEAI
ncbi:glycoside hydrolase [Xylariomycetidae sp. FL2044]|nr:glycoside hydrolase [Xylariomycetidae sp. FL2044]